MIRVVHGIGAGNAPRVLRHHGYREVALAMDVCNRRAACRFTPDGQCEWALLDLALNVPKTLELAGYGTVQIDALPEGAIVDSGDFIVWSTGSSPLPDAPDSVCPTTDAPSFEW